MGNLRSAIKFVIQGIAMSFPYEVGDVLKSTSSLFTVEVLGCRDDGGFRYKILIYDFGETCIVDSHTHVYVFFQTHEWIKLPSLLRELF